MATLLLLPAVGLWTNLARMAVDGSLGATISAADDGVLRRIDQVVELETGLRKPMRSLQRHLRSVTGPRPDTVVDGLDGWLFYTGEGAIEQATGRKLDVVGVERFVEHARSLADRTAAIGGRFLVAVAPNKHTVHRDKLPVGMETVPATTEYDFLVRRLAEERIENVDLRDALAEAAVNGPVYWRGDTHWNDFGATLAYNDIVGALDMPEAELDIDQTFGAPEKRVRTGDLVAMAGIEEPWIEEAPRLRDPDALALQAHVRTELGDAGAYRNFRLGHPAADSDASGPRILVVGDSFTLGVVSSLLMRAASEVIWLAHLGGPGIPDQLGVYAPDIVILSTVERSISQFSQRSGP